MWLLAWSAPCRRRQRSAVLLLLKLHRPGRWMWCPACRLWRTPGSSARSPGSSSSCKQVQVCFRMLDLRGVRGTAVRRETAGHSSED